MSRDTGLKLVATNDIHYTFAEDEKAHDILLCIQTGKKVADEDRMRYEGGQYYCKSEEEMRALFPYAPEAIENTHMIAERCNVEIEFGVTKLPKYEVPEGFDSWSYLNHLCREGFKTRYPDDDGTLMHDIKIDNMAEQHQHRVVGAQTEKHGLAVLSVAAKPALRAALTPL